MSWVLVREGHRGPVELYVGRNEYDDETGCLGKGARLFHTQSL